MEHFEFLVYISMSAHYWLLAARPHTLIASIGPVCLGSALAFHADGFRGEVFASALICALSLQISVNLANDISDAASGVDNAARVGPVRVTQSGLMTKKSVKFFLLLTLAVATSSGIYLLFSSHWILLPFGMLAILAVFAYSDGPWPLASHALGEVCVFLFFGLLALAGTYFAHTHSLTLTTLGFASVVGLLSAAIMLVNNIRDIQSDSMAGKTTLAVRLGAPRSINLYRALLILAAAGHISTSMALGWISLIPLAACLPFALPLYTGIATTQGTGLNELLKKTAILEGIYCLGSSLMLLGAFHSLRVF